MNWNQGSTHGPFYANLSLFLLQILLYVYRFQLYYIESNDEIVHFMLELLDVETSLIKREVPLRLRKA